MTNTRVFYVYLIFDLNGQPRYVGKGKDDRAWSHWTSGSHNQQLQSIINQAKSTSRELPVVLLSEGLSEIEAFDLERLWIKTLGRVDLGTGVLFNHTDGGDGVSGWMTLYHESLTEVEKRQWSLVRSEALLKYYESLSDEERTLRFKNSGRHYHQLSDVEKCRVVDDLQRHFRVWYEGLSEIDKRNFAKSHSDRWKNLSEADYQQICQNLSVVALRRFENESESDKVSRSKAVSLGMVKFCEKLSEGARQNRVKPALDALARARSAGEIDYKESARRGWETRRRNLKRREGNK